MSEEGNVNTNILMLTSQETSYEGGDNSDSVTDHDLEKKNLVTNNERRNREC